MLSSLRVSLLSADKITPIGSADFDLSAHSPGGWARYSGTLTATETTSEAELLVALTAPGEVCVDVVSLFPPVRATPVMIWLPDTVWKWPTPSAGP